jgi:RimJ/RimL family protein N-acetyltransferase
MPNIDPLQDLFFKPRTIFCATHGEYKHRDRSHKKYKVSDHHGVCQTDELPEGQKQFLYDIIGKESVKARLKIKNCSLFLAHQDREPVGFYWSVFANQKSKWHDNVKINEDKGLAFNAYIDPEYRRQGIYTLLQAAVHNYLLSNLNLSKVYTVVENRNIASMKANEKFGLKKCKKNYLIKFLSINILSIFKYDGERQIHFVLNKDNL